MKVSHSTLQKTFFSLGIPIPKNKLVLVAIRGAIPRGRPAGWKKSIQLEPVKINYQHMRCSIGIWNPTKKKIYFAPGSTVPHRDEVLKSATRGGKGSNQPEPGFYRDYYKGEHLMGKKKGHSALRQTATRFVRRTVGRPPFTTKDPLYFSNPYDNLHCSWNPDLRKPGFSSAGCIVVSGTPHCKRIPGSPANSGYWKEFHRKIYAVPQKKFSLLLLEADTFKKTIRSKFKGELLCYGSEGESVKKLQSLLKRKGLYTGPISGKLGARTYKAWNRSGFRKK